MTTAFILVALALIVIYAGPTLLFICVGYADYGFEARGKASQRQVLGVRQHHCRPKR
ncbi:hypothetical protein [Rhizobium sp. Kim5]|uniref:hypothetical protein n=1 Tax=Rhizobium sp. Kim5 TaxID=2020311 RepID=UPI0013DE4F2A|nr:hypothetical protein [Rhizobium sp. Kim5]